MIKTKNFALELWGARLLKAMAICGLVVVGVMMGSVCGNARQAVENVDWEEWQRGYGQGSPAASEWQKNYREFGFEEQYRNAERVFWENEADLNELKRCLLDNAQSKIKDFEFQPATVSMNYSGERLAEEEFRTVEDACRRIYTKSRMRETTTYRKFFFALHRTPQGEKVLYIPLIDEGGADNARCISAVTYPRYPIGGEEPMECRYVCHLGRKISGEWNFAQIITAQGDGQWPGKSESDKVRLTKKTVQELFDQEKDKFAVLAKLLEIDIDFNYRRNIDYFRKEDKKTYDIYNTVYFIQAHKDESEMRKEQITCYQAAENFIAVLKAHGMMPSENVEISHGFSLGEKINIYFKYKDSYKLVVITYRDKNVQRYMQPLGGNWYYAVIDTIDYLSWRIPPIE